MFLLHICVCLTFCEECWFCSTAVTVNKFSYPEHPPFLLLVKTLRYDAMVQQQITYKMAVLYLSHHVTTRGLCAWRVHSRPFIHTDFARRAFHFLAPHICNSNSLPKTVRDSDSLGTFKLRLVVQLTVTLVAASTSEVTTLWSYRNVTIILLLHTR